MAYFCIIKSSELKNGSWSPQDYIGEPEKEQENIDRAEKDIRLAQERLKRRREEQRAAEAKRRHYGVRKA